MREALKMAEDNEEEGVMIVTDSQSLVKALKSKKHSTDKTLEECKERLDKIASIKKVVIQWIPSHVGVRGNGMADEAAKNGTTQEQNDVPIEFKVIKKAINRKVKYKPELDEREKEIYEIGKIKTEMLEKK